MTLYENKMFLGMKTNVRNLSFIDVYDFNQNLNVNWLRMWQNN